MEDWRSIDDLFEEMRQRDEESDEELRRRYELGSVRIEQEREERQLSGRMGRLPK